MRINVVKGEECYLFEFDFENITAVSLLTLSSLRKYLYWEKDFIGNEANVFDNFEDISAFDTPSGGPTNGEMDEED